MIESQSRRDSRYAVMPSQCRICCTSREDIARCWRRTPSEKSCASMHGCPCCDASAVGPKARINKAKSLEGRSAGRPYPPPHDRSSRRYSPDERVHIHPIPWGHFTAAPAPQRLLRASASNLRPVECKFYRTPSRDCGEVTTETWIAAAARELSSRPVARCLSRRGFMTWLCVLLLCTNGTIPPCDPPSPWSWPLDIPVITEKQRPHLASS